VTAHGESVGLPAAALRCCLSFVNVLGRHQSIRLDQAGALDPGAGERARHDVTIAHQRDGWALRSSSEPGRRSNVIAVLDLVTSELLLFTLRVERGRETTVLPIHNPQAGKSANG
jgi:hypothetical protein